jgi:quinoprotein glucose dehydrogenase
VAPWLVRQGPAEVSAAALTAGIRLGLSELNRDVLAFLQDESTDPRLRADALRVLAERNDEQLPAAVRVALASPAGPLRCQGVRLMARAQLLGTATRLEQLAATPSEPIPVRQAALVALAGLEQSESDGILLRLLHSPMESELPAALHLDLLEAAGRSKSAQVQESVMRFKAVTRPRDDPLAPWWETLTGGDALAGRRIFFEKADAGCVRCHKIGEVGGVVGPPLTGIGTQHPRRYLLESLLFPNAVIAKGYEQATLLLRNGTLVVGRVEQETETEMTVRLPDGRSRRLSKGDIEERTAAKSAMPEDLMKVLTARELRDLVEYLAGQQGQSRPTQAPGGG